MRSRDSGQPCRGRDQYLNRPRLQLELGDMALGLLERGDWRQDDPSRNKDGRFVRPPTAFRNFVTADGSAGPTGEDGFPAEAGRYHLYVSLACPWAHRTLIFRKLKKLEDVISVSWSSRY